MENEKVTIERSLGRVEGKLDLMLDQLGKLTGAFEVLEKGRLSKLESKVGYLFGIVAVCSVLIPILITYFLNKLLN